MSSVEETPAHEAADAAPPEDVLVEVEQLIAKLTAHQDPQVGDMLTALLDRVDIVHRTALARLMGAIQSMAGDAFVNRLTADPAIRLLLMSYDLLAVDRRTLAEEALDAVRGHLHAHGIDVELVEVLGGVVSVRLHGAPAPTDPAYEGVRHDIEHALRDGLLGFQELAIEDGVPGRAKTAEPAFLSRQSLQRAQRPVYREVCAAADLVDGAHRSAMVDGVNVLVARVGDELFAVRNACGESPLPLDYSSLQGTELRCSWHGCVYDIRTGRRVDRPQATREEWLSVLPVRLREGVIEIVVGTSALGAVSLP
jgi:nitrite reductase/ring-hydroxylating ferredoxin subunit